MKATIFSSLSYNISSSSSPLFTPSCTRNQYCFMALSTKTTLIISFLILIYICSVAAGNDGGGADPAYSHHKDGFRILGRKLSMLDAVLDYDDAGANPRHDIPRRGRGGRNP